MTQWRSNAPWSHLHHQPKSIFVYLLWLCMLSSWVAGHGAPKLHFRHIENDLNWIHTGSQSNKKACTYKHSQSGSQYLLTWAVVLTASWCETGSCWLAWAWPAQCHWSHSPRLPAFLPPCLPASLPASPACSVYDIKARHSQTGSHAKAHPRSLPLLTALWDGLCTRATSKTPAETPRLCVNHTAAQSHHTHNHKGRTAAQDGVPVCSIAAWRGCLGQWAWQRDETVKPNAKACSLSVCGWAVQGHWFTTLAGPLRGWRVTQSTCTIQ